MYMTPFKCKVTSTDSFSSAKSLGSPQAPVWCEDDQDKCVGGAKQMLYWHQLEGNNIDGNDNNYKKYDDSGRHRSPAYNEKCGFKNGE